MPGMAKESFWKKHMINQADQAISKDVEWGGYGRDRWRWAER